jgi:4-amino-4-deoxy-L-arabinose transferase-like glycosyltransferase
MGKPAGNIPACGVAAGLRVESCAAGFDHECETEFAMSERARDWALLLAVTALLTLPNLGAPSLWDDDEGVNAQAAREMRDSGTWVIPTFNYQLRTAKPVMLYWLQRLSYAAFGVSEWSARLPSVVAGWLIVLLTYELARHMFGRTTGRVAGLVLASAVQFGILVHAATPDATLLLFTTLTYLAFWAGHANGSRRWWVPTAAACGLAVLTKGPVGVALPGLVLLAYFAWNRELNRLLDRRLLTAALVFVLIAGPWYALVASETRGEWVKLFLGRENFTRFMKPLEGHRGPIVYYLLVLPVMFAPWSVFLVPVIWSSVQGLAKTTNTAALPSEPTDSRRAIRFLVCWVTAYLVFFSLAATKLPNYIFPIYPALAILTARFLVGWCEGRLSVPRWMQYATVGGMVLVGVGAATGVVLAAQKFPELLPWAVLGLIPLAGAAGMAVAVRRQQPIVLVQSATLAAIVFVGVTAAVPPAVMNRYKAPQQLVQATGLANPTRDVRLAAYGWFEPSLVFYAGREVRELKSVEHIAEFLAVPTPAYLFVPEQPWHELLSAGVKAPYRIAARHYDLSRNCQVLVITNDLSGTVARQH